MAWQGCRNKANIAVHLQFAKDQADKEGYWKTVLCTDETKSELLADIESIKPEEKKTLHSSTPGLSYL